jgi:hypothetical protein
MLLPDSTVGETLNDGLNETSMISIDRVAAMQKPLGPYVIAMHGGYYSVIHFAMQSCAPGAAGSDVNKNCS